MQDDLTQSFMYKFFNLGKEALLEIKENESDIESAGNWITSKSFEKYKIVPSLIC